MRNEAAERLREWIEWTEKPLGFNPHPINDLDEALATERRNTVERIREAMRDNGGFEGENLDAILDEVAGEGS